jgi:acyl-CoA reductase-like NAD-dependent aldehyde dehydrogenase
VIKPSEFTSASMVEFAALFTEAGFPPGVVNVVTGFGQRGRRAAGHASRRAAHRLHRRLDRRPEDLRAGRQAHFKTVTLELGGKSPNIVFDDADLDQAVKGVVSGIFAASGQSCQAGSRLLLQRKHPRRLRREADRLHEGRQAGRPGLDGHPDRPDRHRRSSTRSWAISRSPRPRARAACWAARAVRTSGRPVRRADHLRRRAQRHAHRAGGSVRPGAGGDPFEDEADAIRIGNDVAYGLAAAVWTRDLKRAMLMTDKLKAGTVWVNNYRATSFTSPFGGYKESGIGRESGMDAIKEYLDTKCVWISSDLEVPNPFIRR